LACFFSQANGAFKGVHSAPAFLEATTTEQAGSNADHFENELEIQSEQKGKRSALVTLHS